MVGRRQPLFALATARKMVVVALVSGIVASCSGSEAAPSRPDPATGDTSTPGSDANGSATGSLEEQAAMRAAEILAMSSTDRETAIADAGLDMELEAAKESGLEAEIGGSDATRAALINAWTPVIDIARGTVAATPQMGFGSAAEPPSLGEGFFGGFLVVGLGAGAAAAATEDRGSGPPASESENGFTLTAGRNQGELAADVTHLDDATGVTTKMLAKVAMVPCPDADGRFEAHATLDVAASKGAASQRGVLQVDVVGYADDDANLASSESEYTMSWSQGGGPGSPDSLVEVSGSSDGPTTVSQPEGGSSGLAASASAGARLFALLIEHSTSSAAQSAWQSGLCVRLDVASQPAPKAVKPGGTAEVDAAPRSKVDGKPVGGTVSASFEGVQAIEPNGSPLPADATFVYSAPGTENLPNHGTVSLEARSRRGVAKASITFEIDRVLYVASGSGDQITFTGNVRDTDFFIVSGEFVGGSATFDFSAGRDDEDNLLPSGVVTITGGGSGATVTGSGTYVIAANDDGTLTITMQTHACVDVSGQCRDSTDTITLTPQS